jgi:hypothetical protein
VTLFWILVIPFLLVLASVTLVDLFRHPYGGWAKAAWCIFIVCLPVIGSLAYWIARRPERGEAERVYQAQADMRHQAHQAPIDRSGF